MRCLFQVILSLTVLLHYGSGSKPKDVFVPRKEAFELVMEVV